MILDVILCALGCMGILGLVWGIGAWCLFPLAGRQAQVLFPGDAAGALERQLRGGELLRAAGIWRGDVFVVTDSMTEKERQEAEILARARPEVQLVTRERLCAILMMESPYDRPRRDDDPRHGAERAVSKPGKRI